MPTTPAFCLASIPAVLVPAREMLSPNTTSRPEHDQNKRGPCLQRHGSHALLHHLTAWPACLLSWHQLKRGCLQILPRLSSMTRTSAGPCLHQVSEDRECGLAWRVTAAMPCSTSSTAWRMHCACSLKAPSFLTRSACSACAHPPPHCAGSLRVEQSDRPGLAGRGQVMVCSDLM